MGNKGDKKYFTIRIRVDEETFHTISKLQNETGLSQRDILGYSSKPCEVCKGISVFAFDSKDKSIAIERGILWKCKLQKYGSYNKKK